MRVTSQRPFPLAPASRTAIALAVVLCVLGAAARPASARERRVAIDAEALPCPRRASLVRETERLLEQALPAEADQPRLRVEITPLNPGRIALQLVYGSSEHRRTLRLRAKDCAELPQTIAWVAAVWLTSSSDVGRLLLLPDPEPPPPPPTPAPSASAVDPENARKPVAPEPNDAEGAGLESALSAGWLQLSLRAGLAAAASRPQTRVALLAGADAWSSQRWGVALTVGFATPTAATPVAPGSVFAQLCTLGALGRISLHPAPATALDLLAGPAVETLVARARGFSKDDAKVLPDAMLLLELRWRQVLSRRLAVTIGCGLGIRAHEERLRIQYLESFAPALSVPRLRGSLNAGLAWTAF